MFGKRKAKENKKRALDVMVRFASGEMTTKEFWERYTNDETIRKILIRDRTRPKYRYNFDPGNFIRGTERIAAFSDMDLLFYFDPKKLSDRIDIEKLWHRDAIYWIVTSYFTRRKQTFEVKNDDAKLHRLINVIQPEWLRPEGYINMLDESFLLGIVDSAPNDLGECEKEQWCKDKILELFRYDVQPPEWKLLPAWPFAEGKPLVFAYQKADENNASRELYYFYDPETKRTEIVEQTA